ncbi:AAA family ATPase [Halomarina litorea]|uniref:AAA family ATPase n=1 Tax=Halomarina litorea TaxID=2961595 RepID=UPI0020C31063|nr:AAA family ATPase [Halomarina sp. BCD28]
MELTVKGALGSTAAGEADVAAGTIRALGVEDGESVRLESDGAVAVATARVGAGATTGEGVARLPRALRRTLDVGVGDTVTVRRADPATAERVTLSLPAAASESAAFDLKDALVGRAVVAGQTLALGRDAGGAGGGGHTADADHAVPVHVAETAPEGPVVVRDWSAIRLSGTATDGPGTVPLDRARAIGYDDVGGQTDAVASLREFVELPLAHPEVFRALDVDPPNGVLLHGPSGTGKTRLVEALGNEAGVPVVRITGAEVVSADAGDADPVGAALAEATEAAPAVLFLDDLDALDEHRGERGRRRVARLVSLLDDRETDDRVAVVGATDRLDAVDPDLRRAGRFDREVPVPVPDRSGRRAVLDVLTRDVPLADDVDLDRVAGRTHGFVGADLERLVREAALRTVRRHGLGPDAERPVEAATLADLTVDATDLDDALTSVDPSALREVFVEVPDVTWDDVGGLEETTSRLRETVQWPLAYPDAFERVSLRPSKGVLLYGPPGTGKTLLAKVVANESDANFISVKGPEVLDKFVGESEKGVREVFEKARANAPTVVFFDEIDALAAERGGGAADSGVSERVVSQLLTELDGLEELEDVVVVATTNRRDLLDDALLRPGRFDRHVHVGTPDETARREILTVHTRDRPLADDVDLDGLAARTEGYVGADLEAVCREAAATAVREFVHDGGHVEDIHLTADHFEAGLAAVRDDRDGAVPSGGDPTDDTRRDD